MQLIMVFCPTRVCPLTYSQFKFGKQVEWNELEENTIQFLHKRKK